VPRHEAHEGIDEGEHEQHPQLGAEPAAVEQHPPAFPRRELGVEPVVRARRQELAQPHVHVPGLHEVVHETEDDPGAQCGGAERAPAQIHPRPDEDRRREPDERRQRRRLRERRQCRCERHERELRAAQPGGEQECRGQRDHCGRRDVGHAGRDVAAEAGDQERHEEAEPRREAAVDADGLCGDPRRRGEEERREAEAEQSSEWLVEAERRPDAALEDVEERTLVLGLADPGEAEVRPVLRNHPRPHAERHRVPLAVRKREGDEQRGREEKNGQRSERGCRDRRRPEPRDAGAPV
jgi:colicin import membrane protein